MRTSRIVWLVVASLLAAGIGFAASELTSSSTPKSIRWTVSSANVAFGFDQLLTDHSGLFLAGFNYNNACESASVNPRSLRTTTTSAPCGDVPPGEKFSVKYERISSLHNFQQCDPESAAVRLTSLAPNGTAKVGRIIMRVLGACSHAQPSTVYADGALWVYDSSSGPTGRTGAIVELSASTGSLLTSVTIPGMQAAVIGADDDGFYIGPGDFYHQSDPLYRIAPGSSHAQLLRKVPGEMPWLFGIGHTMYAAIEKGGGISTVASNDQLWSFVGSSSTAKLLNNDFDSGGGQEPAGNAGGIFIVQPKSSTRATSVAVERIDPTSGKTQTLAHLPESQDQFVESTTYFSGNFYVLMSQGQLFRVAAS